MKSDNWKLGPGFVNHEYNFETIGQHKILLLIINNYDKNLRNKLAIVYTFS